MDSNYDNKTVISNKKPFQAAGRLNNIISQNNFAMKNLKTAQRMKLTMPQIINLIKHSLCQQKL